MYNVHDYISAILEIMLRNISCNIKSLLTEATVPLTLLQDQNQETPPLKVLPDKVRDEYFPQLCINSLLMWPLCVIDDTLHCTK